jgi:hypothetical protein
VLLDERFDPARRAHAQPGVTAVVHGVDAHERRTAAQAECVEETRDEPGARLRRLAAADQVDGGVEAVAAAAERVAVTADAVVALEQQHALAGAREERAAASPPKPPPTTIASYASRFDSR